MIRFQKISKQYEDTVVLHEMSFEIQAGELVVLIGPSGCGKTTLLKMINRLIKPTSGSILINQKSISKIDPIKLRRNIGYVIQQTGLFPHMTVRENIQLIPKLQKKPALELNNRTYELMSMVGLDPEQYLDRYPTQLSGGQQQRIGVARAFACDPDIILMDEPFSALDPITRSGLQEELSLIHAKVKKTIVFVTHDMDEAIKIADRICLMNQGRIVQYDTPEEIMKNPISTFAEEFIGKNRIWSSPEYIRAIDIMIENPICAAPDTPALRCIEKMRNQKVDRLFIIDTNKVLLGMVSAKIIQSHDNKQEKVYHIMRTDLTKVKPEDSIIEILQMVKDKNLSAIPVVDNKNKLLGLITKTSLVTTLSQQYMDTPEDT